MRRWFKDTPYRKWGSACSGTESPQWCFDSCEQAFGLDHGFDHAFSAELSSQKRDFIRSCCGSSLRQLYADMFELAQTGGGINTLTGRKEQVDGKNTWGVLIGFSCKTASGLATDKETAESCIEEEAGTTGQTFLAVRLIAQTIKPLWLFLENVTGLLKGQQWLLVVRRLRSHGYAVAVLHSTPTRFGLPHNRNRLWFHAVRMDLLDMAHMTEDEYIKRVEAWDNLLHQGHRQMSLDSMLLSECDPVV